MNFFERQELARRRSRWLVLAFLAAVVAVILAIDGIAWTVMSLSREHRAPPLTLAEARPVLLVLSLLTLAVIAIASLVKTAGLRGGGGAVARALGGTRVTGDEGDFQLRRLRNVVEEMAIASGVPVPEIYVLEQESGINAFAAGWSPASAAVAVTRGALDQLRRDELQGVIAHEFSHVLNGDMRLNIRLMGVLFGLLVIAIIGRKIMRGAAEADDGRAALAGLAIGFATMTVGYIGVLFGHAIKAGVSRQREFLADASAVQFTRQNTGIAGALKKIAGIGSRLADAEGENVSHMLFADGLGSRIFATHPPIELRIVALDPTFRPTAGPAVPAQAEGLIEDTYPVSALAPAAGAVPVSAAAVVAQAGDPSFDHVRFAAGLRQSLPAALVEVARRPVEAPALLLALLLEDSPAVRSRQERAVREALDAAQAERALRLQAETSRLQPLQRLPLALLAMPSLRNRPPPELQRLRRAVRALMHADGSIKPFEYAFGAMLDAQLGDSARPAAGRPRPGLTLALLRDEVGVVLTELARAGQAGREDAAAAFARGLERALPGVRLAYDPPLDWTQRLDAALRRLDLLVPPLKERLLLAFVDTIVHDGRVTADEYEFLRLLCATLHCPLPPLLAPAA